VSDLADELMRRVTGLRRVVRQRLREQWSGPPLRGSQVELLQVVEESPGIGVAAAARALHLAGNSVSALAGQLIDLGYLRRETDAADRRAARLYLTPVATKRLLRWRAARAALVADGIADLSTEDRHDIERALPALGRLTAALSPPRSSLRGDSATLALPRKRVTPAGRLAEAEAER
jgi:DNA-binding MarR family transcriptional regulator